MKSYFALFFFIFSITFTSQAQITKELLNSIPTLKLNKDYDFENIKRESDKLQKKVSFTNERGKTYEYQVIAKIQIKGNSYLLTFDDYYKPEDKYIPAISLKKYNPETLEHKEKSTNEIDVSIFVHKAQFDKIIYTLRFESEHFVVLNETQSIKLSHTVKYGKDYGKEELLINVDKFPELPLNEDFDIKKTVEIINKTKAEAFCNVDGYCHFNVLGKVQGKKQLHIFLGYNYDLTSEYNSYEYMVISIKGKNLKAWISPDNWYPYTERAIDSFKVTKDKTKVIIKKDGQEIIKELY